MPAGREDMLRIRFATFFLTMVMVGCSSSGESPLTVGTQENGGAFGGGSGGRVSFDARDATTAEPLTVHVEETGTAVQSVKLGCDDPCADVAAVASGGVAPYSYVWDDGSTGSTRRICAGSAASYQVTVTDSGSTSGEFGTSRATAQAMVTTQVAPCPSGGDGGMFDAGHPDAGSSCATAPVAGTYTGNNTSNDLAGLPVGGITFTLVDGPGVRLSGTVTLNVAGILHATFPVDGDIDCTASEYVLRGVSVDSGDNLCGCGGTPWVFAGTYDHVARTFNGDWAKHDVMNGTPVTPPLPHEKAASPIGDNGSYTTTWMAP